MLEQDFLGKMIWWPTQVELAGVRRGETGGP